MDRGHPSDLEFSESAMDWVIWSSLGRFRNRDGCISSDITTHVFLRKMTCIVTQEDWRICGGYMLSYTNGIVFYNASIVMRYFLYD